MLEQVPKRLALSLPANHVLFVGMDEARFSKRAKPGDEITLELEMARMRAPLVVFNGRVSVGDQPLARVEGLTLAFGDIHAVEGPVESATAPVEDSASMGSKAEPVPVASF
jgi:hypothetical protein